jgi:transducin (beta)-like 1
VKVWTTESDSALWDFSGHQKEVYTLRWSPISGYASSSSLPTATSNGPIAGRRLLATASFDNTIRIWDVSNGQCLYVLEDHSGPVYSVSFSPDGQYLVSGSMDQTVNVWRLKDGTLAKTMRGAGGAYEVAWASQGDVIAACFTDGLVRYYGS